MIYAKYTEVLKNLLDNEQTKPLIDNALSKYPMYEPENDFVWFRIPTREELNQKLINYYKYREIGFETVGRFIDELETSMTEIMTYYNGLFKSVDILNGIEDPFGNVDVLETFEQETSGKTESSSNSKVDNKSNSEVESETDSSATSKNKHVKSSTPQSELNTSLNEIDSVKYADEVVWNKDESNTSANSKDTSSGTSESNSEGSSESNSEGLTKHTLHKKGNQGVNTYAHDLKELRELFINIEQQIIQDERISELFMRVY